MLPFTTHTAHPGGQVGRLPDLDELRRAREI